MSRGRDTSPHGQSLCLVPSRHCRRVVDCYPLAPLFFCHSRGRGRAEPPPAPRAPRREVTSWRFMLPWYNIDRLLFTLPASQISSRVLARRALRSRFPALPFLPLGRGGGGGRGGVARRGGVVELIGGSVQCWFSVALAAGHSSSPPRSPCGDGGDPRRTHLGRARAGCL